MDLRNFYPTAWFKHEDKTPAVQRGGVTPRQNFHSEIDRMFDSFLDTFGYPPMADFFRQDSAGIMLKPKLDLEAADNQHTISVELPGVDEKDVSVELEQGRLTISGEKKRETEDKDEKMGACRIERSYGYFSRTLALPEDAGEDGIKATFDKGVLRLTIPRIETRKDSKKIEITRG